MKLETLKIDAKLAEEGVWQEYEGDWELRLARYPNKKFTNALARRIKNLPNAQNMDEDEIRPYAIPEFCKHVLKDWRGLEDANGEVPFSVEKALEILSNPDYEFMFDDWILMARNRALFRAATLEEQAKN